MSAADATPLSAAEGFALLRAVLGDVPGHCILAVSGGADSVALLLLAAENRARFAALGRRFTVASVDHGLRAESASEAHSVAQLAARLGLSHRTLRASVSPIGNRSAAAREARYGCLYDLAREIGADTIALAHHRDDQLETHLMAVGRGEGALRLAAMRPRRAFAPGVDLVRPFLPVGKGRLIATLRDREVYWVEDPTNRDARFERTRLRERLALMPERERAALARDLDEAGRRRLRIERTLAPLLAHAAVDREGVVRVERRSLLDGDHETRSVLLARLLQAANGGSRTASAEASGRMLARLETAEPVAATLAGCRVDASATVVSVGREYGRDGPRSVRLAPGDRQALFDGRFEVRLPTLDGPASLVPLGRLGRGRFSHRTLPVLLGDDGSVLASHPALAGRLGPDTPLILVEERVSWRLRRDTGPVNAADGIVANPASSVGSGRGADYLPSDREAHEHAGCDGRPLESAMQDGR